MSKSRLPVPETKVALLPSFGYGGINPRITKHTYTRTVECELPGEGPAYEFLFACEETGHERRWGTVDREEELEN